MIFCTDAPIATLGKTARMFGMLALSALLAGCKDLQASMDKTAIESVLHDTGLTGTAKTDEHVHALKSIDIGQCPQDFRDGYIRYIHAWEEEAAVEKGKEQLAERRDPAALAALFSTLLNLSATPWADQQSAEAKLDEYAKTADADLVDASKSLNDLARRHGVNITDS